MTHDGDLGPCRCGAEQWQPRCAECERTHCEACGHPRWYRTDSFEPRACGCVEHYQRAVSRHSGETVVTWWHRGTASLCAAHAAEIAAKREAQDARERAFWAGAPPRDTPEHRAWLRVAVEDARRRNARNGG